MADYGKLREAQLLELDLLKKFREICEKEGMHYYLLGGTAIGAVRHKGFIPWDDDIDVGLLREDYDRFVGVAAQYLSDGQKVLHYSLDAKYSDYTMKLVNTKMSYLIQHENTVLKQNVWIDIFPLDGAPDSKFMRWIHFRTLDFVRMKIVFHSIKETNDVRIDKERPAWKKALVWVAKNTPVGQFVDPSKEKRKLDKEFRKYPASSSAIIGNYMGAYHEKEFFPVSYFAEGSVVEFEGEQFIAPKELDKYLTHQYGNYMKLPPKCDQIPKHYVLDIIQED